MALCCIPGVGIALLLGVVMVSGYGSAQGTMNLGVLLLLLAMGLLCPAVMGFMMWRMKRVVMPTLRHARETQDTQ